MALANQPGRRIHVPIGRPSPALAVALFALVLSVAGNAAAATSVIITTSKQVAPHTIAGANAPSGANKNLIPGSVGSSDLHGGAVTYKQLAADSQARKIYLAETNSTTDENATVVIDELTLHLRCEHDSDQDQADFWASSTIPATVNGTDTMELEGGAPNITMDGQTFGGAIIAGWGVPSPHLPSRVQVEVFIEDTNRVLMVSVHAVAAFDGHICQITGTAIPATT